VDPTLGGLQNALLVVYVSETSFIHFSAVGKQQTLTAILQGSGLQRQAVQGVRRRGHVHRTAVQQALQGVPELLVHL
jgi:hypothetical protein